jgi:beta-glucanase (GH16 family)
MASATGLPVAATSAPSKQATTAVLHHRVATAGRYDVRIVIATRSGRRSNWPKATVRVEIGKVSRLAVTGGRGRAHLSAILPLKRGTLTIRARASRTRPAITVTLSRLSAPSTKATGGSGSTSSTGSTGSTGALTPAPVPVAVPLAVQAPLTASFAPDGAPILALPNGFSAITNYTNLVKDYEFDGSTLPADFRASANNSHGAHATMYQPSQVTLTGSSVSLTAIPQASDGFPYTSGYISTQGQYSYNYGLIDFRAKMPAGQGLWSGLWLDQPDGSNPWGEIDVQEMLLNDVNTVHGSAHGWAPSQWSETQDTQISDATAAYHDYQLAWQPGLLTWAVDGIAYAQYSEEDAIANGYPWVFDDGTGFYIIASLTVGAADEWPGAPNATTIFPASMQVASIKLWQ